MTGLNQTARCVISFNQDDEIEMVTLDEEQMQFVEVDEIPGEMVQTPEPGVVVVVWDDQDVLRCVTADGDVSFRETDFTSAATATQLPSQHEPPKVPKVSLAQMQEADEKEQVSAFELLSQDGGVDFFGFRVLVSYYYYIHDRMMHDNMGSPVQEWWSGKARDRLDFTTVKAYLDNNVPTHEMFPKKLLWLKCRERDTHGTGMVGTPILADVLFASGLSQSEQVELMRAHSSLGDYAMVDYAAFARQLAETEDNPTVMKLGWLLRHTTNCSLLRYAIAMAVMPQSCRVSLPSLHRQVGRNLPSSAIYPRPDSNATPLASLSLGPDRLLVPEPGRGFRVTLHDVCGLPVPDSSFTVVSTHANLCLANANSIVGATHQVHGEIQDNLGHWAFNEQNSHNPAIVRLPEEPKLTNDPLQRLVLLIELTATVRRRCRQPNEDQQAVHGVGEPGESEKAPTLQRGSILAGELKKKNKSFGYRTRYVTYDWGKGLSVYETADDAASGSVMKFVPLSQVTAASTHAWREFGFVVQTTEREYLLAAENEAQADMWIRTIRKDMDVDKAVSHDQKRANLVLSISLGWVAIEVAKTPVMSKQTLKLTGGSLFSPQPFVAADLSVKSSGMFESGFVEPALTLTISEVMQQDLAYGWIPRLPILTIFSEGTVPFVVLYRQAFADKLIADSSGFHWSLVQSSDDPALTWFPSILDSTDTMEAFHSIWAKHGLTPAQMRASPNRKDIDYLLDQWRASVMQLYPALVECPVLELERESTVKTRQAKLRMFVDNPVEVAMTHCAEFCKPFHTEELVCDPVHALIPPQEALFLSASSQGHFGDMASADIMILIQRLVDLLEKGLNPGGRTASFAVFFEAALSSTELRELSRFGYRSLGELDAAFRRHELRNGTLTPKEARRILKELELGNGKLSCSDPYNVCMSLTSGECVFFSCTASDSRNWKIAADFFFDTE